MTLYTMARVDCDEETPPKAAEWKEACSSALMATVCYSSKFIPVTEFFDFISGQNGKQRFNDFSFIALMA